MLIQLPRAPLPKQPRRRRCLPPPSAQQVVSKHSAIPEAQGLFNPENDKDSCGVGFVAGAHGTAGGLLPRPRHPAIWHYRRRSSCSCSVLQGALTCPAPLPA